MKLPPTDKDVKEHDRKKEFILVRRVWRYQGSNQNPKIEGQPVQMPKEKRHSGKQRSAKYYTFN